MTSVLSDSTLNVEEGSKKGIDGRAPPGVELAA